MCSILPKGINEDLYIYFTSLQMGHVTKEADIFTYICTALFIVNPNHSFNSFYLNTNKTLLFELRHLLRISQIAVKCLLSVRCPQRSEHRLEAVLTKMMFQVLIVCLQNKIKQKQLNDLPVIILFLFNLYLHEKECFVMLRFAQSRCT